ncbi:leucine zipper domain-containing protein [Phenylobacterium immobile]|uniref:leucine zipper domain-containing protein n=1 Tax=Phenylobacterium immobile TaxID=21 RepID=UPI000AEBEDE9
MEQPAAPMALDTEGGQQRRKAMARFAVLRPVLDDEVPLTFAARAAGVPLRTAQRWLARYRMHGLSGLERLTRSDAGVRQTPADLVGLIEGMALKRPRVSAATIHRRVFIQIERILKINGLSVITDDVVEAARSTLVIGAI